MPKRIRYKYSTVIKFGNLKNSRYMGRGPKRKSTKRYPAQAG